MISLRLIDAYNFHHVCDLTVDDTQKPFIAPNVYSIAEAKIYPEATIRAIYFDQTPIGFLMFSRTMKDNNKPWIMRFMIDHKFQGLGYGKIALNQALQLIQATYGVSSVYLSAHKNNTAAIRFYEAFGFKSTFQLLDQELVFKKDAPRQ